MITHLQDDYIHHFGLTGMNYQVLHSVLNGHSILFDPKSCDPCISNNRQQCDNASSKQIFILETIENVTCVNIEAFLNQFSGKKAGKTSEMSSSDLHSHLSHGFVFKTVTFPEVYVW